MSNFKTIDKLDKDLKMINILLKDLQSITESDAPDYIKKCAQNAVNNLDLAYSSINDMKIVVVEENIQLDSDSADLSL